MSRRSVLAPVVTTLLTLWLTAPGHAEVTRIEIDSRTDVLEGQAFGLAGAYEALVGTIYFTLDPNDPANRAIVDIALAPLDRGGRVEFSSDLYVLKPVDPARGNGTLLFDVVNRGNKVALGLFNRGGGGPDPAAAGDVGDGFLLEQGYTLVWIGWQFDVVPGGGRMRLEAPVATANGDTIEGLVRYWFRTNTSAQVQSLDGPARGTVPYLASEPDAAGRRLTVREGVLDEPQTIPLDRWSFSRLENGVRVPDASSIHIEDGFEAGMLYEVVYESRNPAVAGLGYAGVRDAVSHLRYDDDLVGTVDRSLAFGLSQSGRFLRGFLYEGFNADTDGRIVFDGVLTNVAASVRSGFNRRFVQPSVVEPARFPFSTVEQTDPVTGRTDGLLSSARAVGTAPKLMTLNSSNEYWTEWKVPALVHVSVDGRSDLTTSRDVRVYTLAGTQHGPGTMPPSRGAARYLRNANDYSWALRALLTAMNSWVRDGTSPPESRHPRLEDRTLVGFDDLLFPDLPGVVVPPGVVGTYNFDDGDRFDQGIVDRIPPGRGEPYPVLLPQVDADGNELAGIRLPVVAVPLATFTGWNLRDPQTGAPSQSARLTGAYLPFPRTRSERESEADPRLSIEERYASRSDYLGRWPAPHSNWSTRASCWRVMFRISCDRRKRTGSMRSATDSDFVSRPGMRKGSSLPHDVSQTRRTDEYGYGLRSGTFADNAVAGKPG